MRKNNRSVAIALLLTIVLCLVGCFGNETPNQVPLVLAEENQFPIDAGTVDLVYLLGIGAWATNLTIAQDGSFHGQYHDADMGDIGNGYPNGTMYICNFTGNFRIVRQINDYSFVVALDALVFDKPDRMWIEEGIRYITSEPSGLVCGEEFLFFTPDAPLDQMSDDFLFWWSLRCLDDANSNRLGVYALYNPDQGSCFLSAL